MTQHADNIKRLRKNAKLTQAQLAELAVQPRATLANLERSGSNPGVQSVMSVAKALNVTLDELMTPAPQQRYYKVTSQEIQEYRAEGGRFLDRLVSPIASKGVQIHYITMLPGCHSVGRPHPRGSQEFFLTLSGTASLHIEQEIVSVESGALVQFPGHHRHIYENKDAINVVTAISVVVFQLG
jgi:XRE family transcriptional regulator, regulator of sulfur utilization